MNQIRSAVPSFWVVTVSMIKACAVDYDQTSNEQTNNIKKNKSTLFRMLGCLLRFTKHPLNTHARTNPKPLDVCVVWQCCHPSQLLCRVVSVVTTQLQVKSRRQSQVVCCFSRFRERCGFLSSGCSFSIVSFVTSRDKHPTRCLPAASSSILPVVVCVPESHSQHMDSIGNRVAAV